MPRRAGVRSYEPIARADLQRLVSIARADRLQMFERNPRWASYEGRLLCVCLAQGAAQHLLDGRHGIKDFDVWTFFSRSPERPFPDAALFRRNGRADFGVSRFGRTQSAPAWMAGRRVDLLSRSLDVAPGADPAGAVRAWLARGREASARRLAEKAMVMLEPRLGVVVWPG